jgi:hypothetical protein
MQQMDSLTNCFETETGLNAPNSPLDTLLLKQNNLPVLDIIVVYPIQNGHFMMADCTSSKR